LLGWESVFCFGNKICRLDREIPTSRKGRETWGTRSITKSVAAGLGEFAAQGVGWGRERCDIHGHRHVDVLEDLARGDADDAFGGFDEIVAFAAGVLASEGVDEAES
jgi:hypothetical protein